MKCHFTLLLCFFLCSCAGTIKHSTVAFDKKMFRENEANVTDKAVVYQNIAGEDAMSITLNYSMKGGKVDWARRGVKGFAQRWQIQLRKSTPANTTAWYTFKFNTAIQPSHSTQQFNTAIQHNDSTQ